MENWRSAWQSDSIALSQVGGGHFFINMNLNYFLLEFHRFPSPPIVCRNGKVYEVRVGPTRKCSPASFQGPWETVELSYGTTVIGKNVQEFERGIIVNGGYDWLKIPAPGMGAIRAGIRQNQPEMFSRERLIEIGHSPSSYQSFRGLSGQTYVLAEMKKTGANLLAIWRYNPREYVLEPGSESFANAKEFRTWARTQG